MSTIYTRRAIWLWRTKRLVEEMPHIPAYLFEGLPEGGEVATSAQGDPWNCPAKGVSEELRPIVEAILAEEKEGGPVVRPPFARPVEGKKNLQG